jgi:hypothetical protein
MKKTAFILLISLLIQSRLLAQTDPSSKQAGKTQAAAFGINIPVAEFSETHIAGLSSSYSWSNHRFGKLDALPKKRIGFTAHGGVDYYFGKKVIVAGYDFKYGGYTCLHTFGGVIYNPVKKGNIMLTTGPAMSLYKGNADVGFGVMLNGSYYYDNKIAFTPGAMYMKHDKTNALWVISLKASYIF